MKESIQRVGGAMAGMVIPNIGAFIAWGLITALFIPTGWVPNEGLSEMVGPMIVSLLPILIGYTGGKMVHGHRGGVIGAVVSKNVIGPILQGITDFLGNAAGALVDAGLVPLADIPIEVAKVLFLNNAINHGVLGPLGAAEAAETGQSIWFLLETNPGPGLGLLLAYWFAGTGMWKQSAPGSIIIHFFGGIHEIYFPYVLGHPIMILSMWAGGISADLWFQITGAGLVATPSPGSIFAYLAVTPRGGHFAVLGGVLIGAVAAAVVGTIILRARPITETDAGVEDTIDVNVPTA